MKTDPRSQAAPLPGDRRIDCPRCGYDQRGQIATWTDRCPMNGTCVECGYELNWSRVFMIARHPWLFELNWRDRPFRRVALTLLYGLRPRAFWREITLEDTVDLRPVIVVGALLLVVFITGYAVTTTIVIHALHQSAGYQGAMWDTTYWEMIFSHVWQTWAEEMLPSGMAPLAALACGPLVYLMLSFTRAPGKVRFGHIARVWIYGWILPVVVITTWYAMQATLFLLDYPSIAGRINPWQLAFDHGWGFFGLDELFVVAAGLAGICSLWLAFWWTVACRSYLQLDTPRFVAIMMALVSGLFGITFHALLLL